jgi:hypothetical protein
MTRQKIKLLLQTSRERYTIQRSKRLKTSQGLVVVGQIDRSNCNNFKTKANTPGPGVMMAQ